MNKYLLIVFILLPYLSPAQNHWMYLPNKDLIKGSFGDDSAYRIEDVYFTDTLTGFAVTIPGRLLKTKDGGLSWQTKNDTSNKFQYPLFRSIEFSDDGTYGIASSLGADANLLRSTDGGETWTDVSSKVSTPSINLKYNICGLAHYGDNFYGVGYWGSDTGRFYKSIDKGATWSCSLLDTGLIKNMVDVVFLSATTGFISGAHRDKAVVIKTTDGGNTWTRVFTDSIIGGRIWKLQAMGNNIYGSIEPRYFKDTVCMIRSDDNGNSWRVIAAGSIGPKGALRIGTQGVGFATPAKGWIGGYYDGIFETNDSGKNWVYVKFGYDFNRIFVVDSNHIYAGGHMLYKYGSGIYTGLKHITQSYPKNSITISPNPAKDKVDINITLLMGTSVLLEVFNVESRMTYRVTNKYFEKGSHKIRWDCSNVPAGNYMVWFDNNEIPQSVKLVISK